MNGSQTLWCSGFCSALMIMGLLALNAFGQSGGGSYQVTSSVIGGGGGASCDGLAPCGGSNTFFKVEGTAGEPAAGDQLLRNPPYSHRAGFWYSTLGLTPTAADGAVSGRITDQNGKPVEGVAVRMSGTQNRLTVTDTQGDYHFEDVQTNGFYIVTPSRANYSFNPFNRSFTQIGNKTEATFTGMSMGDNANPLDTAEYFVRQQYVDILSREPDEPGFNYWSDQINRCLSEPPAVAGGPTVSDCISARRIGVASAFFIENEFQASGSFIYDVYAGALGRRPAFAEYSSDRRQIIGGATLETEKTAFAQSFVERAEFAAKYQANMAADSFVDTLLQTVRSSGVDLSGERASLINAYNGGANNVESRAAVVRAIADNATFKQAQYNSAFVLTEYFGYLRRDPDQSGYDFWLNVISNRQVGNYRGMVCSFITSTEYQRRFSTIVTHSNGECGQ